MVEPCVVLVVRAEDEGHDFGPAGDGALCTHDVGELVDGQGGSDGGGFRGEATRKPVEAVPHRRVFHQIRLVQHVGARDGNSDVEGIGVGGGGYGGVAHFLQQGAEVLAWEFEAEDGVDVAGRGTGAAGGEVRGDAGLGVVVGEDADGLDGEGDGAILAEHSDDDLSDDFDFRFVGGRDVDEDIACAEGDF